MLNNNEGVKNTMNAITKHFKDREQKILNIVTLALSDVSDYGCCDGDTWNELLPCMEALEEIQTLIETW